MPLNLQPEGETNPLKFSQTFHLAPVGGSFVVTNDLFRCVPGTLLLLRASLLRVTAACAALEAEQRMCWPRRRTLHQQVCAWNNLG